MCTNQSVGYLRVDTVCESRFSCALVWLDFGRVYIGLPCYTNFLFRYNQIRCVYVLHDGYILFIVSICPSVVICMEGTVYMCNHIVSAMIM